ncbi:MAG: PDZ domain-containing protein [Candidatus Stygibacter frigidus]|nr:PDZ domain-containing protein [Candidatus Stygibacter frigidus]
MKKNLVVLVLALLLAGSLFCQDVNVEVEEAQLKSEMAQQKADQVIKELEQLGEKEYTVNVKVDDNGNKIVITSPGDVKMDKPFIGITYSDMTLAEASEIGYNYFYGIRIDNVVPDSPAYYYKLRTDDILMSINDDKIVKQDELGKILSFYRVEEKVILTVFRKGEVVKLDFVFGTRNKIFDINGNLVEDKTAIGTQSETVIKTKSKYYGDGTIAWMPIWYTPDLVDVNGIMESLGFEADMYSEDGLFLNGIALKSHIGKGWFIGGQYAQYFDKTTSRHDWNHGIDNLDGSSNVQREAKYWIHYGGLSFDRRFVFGKIYSELGCMFTWGMNNIEVDQKAKDDVPDYDFVTGDLDNYLDEYFNLSSSIKFRNTGFLAEPRFSLGWRITDWLSFKAEAAYLYTISMSGWEAEANGYDINLTNRPDTNMDGLTLSFGPWFGF